MNTDITTTVTSTGTVAMTQGGVVLELWENMYFNPETGEAIAQRVLPESVELEPTGWYFMRPAQMLPKPDAPDGLRFVQYISPWGFATLESTSRLAGLVHNLLKPGEALDGLSSVDANFQFPVSCKQWQIKLKLAKPMKLAAGLLIQTLCRYPASAWEFHITAELDELRRQANAELA